MTVCNLTCHCKSICDWTCENRVCGHMIFAYFFKLPCLLYQYAMAMKLLAVGTHLIGFTMQVTECKYSFPLLRYVMGHSLCPHALFSQARSHTYYALKIAHYALSSAQKQTVLCQNCAFKIKIVLEY